MVYHSLFFPSDAFHFILLIDLVPLMLRPSPACPCIVTK